MGDRALGFIAAVHGAGDVVIHVHPAPGLTAVDAVTGLRTSAEEAIVAAGVYGGL